MANLAIPRLLKMIDTTHIDPEILARCREALRLHYRGKTDQALALGRTLVRMTAIARCVDKREFAAETRRRTSTGIALLYLAYLRHLSNIPMEQRRALITGQSALTWLAHDDYHHALAELTLACMARDEGQFEATARTLQSALSRLDKIIAVQHRKNNPHLENQYQELKQSAQETLRQLHVAQRPVAPPLPPLEESTERDWLDQIKIPAELIWTNIDLAGLQLIPVQTAERNVAILSEHVKVLPDRLDYIEIDHLSIGGKHYQIVAPPAAQGKFRMQTSQPYYAFQFATEREQPQPGQPQFVLVRPHDRPLPPDWPIVILIPAEQRALLVRSQPPASPLIIGERVWSVQDGTEVKTYDEDDVQIAGAVVALLMPLESSSTE